MTSQAQLEREIVADIEAANVKLRFDKVAKRLAASLKESLATMIPDRNCIIVTVTAPIVQPLKTRLELETLVRAGLAGSELRKTINGNGVCLRLIALTRAPVPRVMVFVHNRECIAASILDLAESRLQGRLTR